MGTARALRLVLIAVWFATTGVGAYAQALPIPNRKPPKPTTEKPSPKLGQPGKDVVWVPTPQPAVEKMLDLAKVTAQDYVMDLGSGDGRTVITAAKRGAQAIGIEYNLDLVELSKKHAEAAGVAAKATFIKADLFETDFSKATVITLFLGDELNMKLRPKILDLKPGTRIVSTSFTMADWEADDTVTVTDDCESWCTLHLWIVPAKVEGTWTLPQGSLALKQRFQKISGRLGSVPISNGKLRGDEITFTVGKAHYIGHVNGNSIQGIVTGKSGTWNATKR
jgi:SAM-dependent methyltransferase